MSEATAKRLLEKRANVAEQARALLDRVDTEDRSLSADEVQAYNEMNAEIDALQARANTLLEQAQRAKDSEAVFEDVFKRSRTPGVVTPTEQGEAAALRAFAAGETREFHAGLETRDVLKSGSGANVVPSGFYNRIWEYAVETAHILDGSYVTFLATADGQLMSVPKRTVAPTAASATEGSPITESDPTYASASLSVTKDGFVTQVSEEMIADSGVDILGLLARDAGRELGNKVAANAVSVLLAGVTPSVTGPTGDTGGFGSQSVAGSGYDKIIDLFYSLLPEYLNRPSTAWVMSNPTAGRVRKIKTSDGQYIWVPSVIVGQPDTILGKPVVIDTNVPDVALSAESVLFGDLSSLYVRIAGGITFKRDDSVGFTSDLVTFKATVRHGAVSVDPNAVKSFVGAAS